MFENNELIEQAKQESKIIADKRKEMIAERNLVIENALKEGKKLYGIEDIAKNVGIDQDIASNPQFMNDFAEVINKINLQEKYKNNVSKNIESLSEVMDTIKKENIHLNSTFNETQTMKTINLIKNQNKIQKIENAQEVNIGTTSIGKTYIYIENGNMIIQDKLNGKIKTVNYKKDEQINLIVEETNDIGMVSTTKYNQDGYNSLYTYEPTSLK